MSFKNSFKKTAHFVIVLIFVAILSVSITRIELVIAVSLSSLSDTLSSVKVNTLSDHTIQFVTPSGISAAQLRSP